MATFFFRAVASDGKMRTPKSMEVRRCDALDAAGLRRAVLSLERKVSKNQEMRAKFHDEPQKFLESEVELDEDLKRLKLIG